MMKAVIGGGMLTVALVLAALLWSHGPGVNPSGEVSTNSAPTEWAAHPAQLYGLITTHDGVTYEGRLRWGGDQEAFWGDYFNGFKDGNVWADLVPQDRLRRNTRSIHLFGMEIAYRKSEITLDRPFLARFGDIVSVGAVGADVQVRLKSGTTFSLDRLSANDHDDGVSVWDREHGAVSLDSRQVRMVEFLPAAGEGTAPDRLHGTVRTSQGEFTGFIQWDRRTCLGSERLRGNSASGTLELPFSALRSITRRSADSALATLHDGREFLLAGTRDVGAGHLGIHVDDRRYGRVLVSWEAFEHVDFTSGGGGPGYDDYPPGRPLTGCIITRDGRRLAGRLVYDLDESETTETLDAPSRGVTYNIPFGLIASVRSSGVTLHSGEALSLERAGDLGPGNAGMLVFVDGESGPEYVPWADVEQIDLDRPPAMFPPMP